ncbi:MAG: hypothetical protein Q8M96_17910, partial [Rubrivivax sp.]|nr:hypothetical protein [Rubrivivax sp.]
MHEFFESLEQSYPRSVGAANPRSSVPPVDRVLAGAAMTRPQTEGKWLANGRQTSIIQARQPP